LFSVSLGTGGLAGLQVVNKPESDEMPEMNDYRSPPAQQQAVRASSSSSVRATR
jgi:hypothetical protein